MKKTLVLAVLAGAVAPVGAEVLLDATVVTASRFEEPLDATVRSVSVITRAQIERSGARDLADLLERLPGVQIGRNGGAGQATSIFLRGTASDHVLVLIDGVPAQSATTGATAVQHLDPESIERIELVRGPASTLYGSSAIGGVIQIFTRDPQEGLGARVAVGSEGDFRAAASVAGRSGDLRASVSLSRQQTDGYPPLATSTRSRGYRHDTLDLRADYALGGDHGLSFSHWQSRGNVEYLNAFTGAPLDQDVFNAVTRVALTLSHGGDHVSRLSLGRALDRSDENQPNFLGQFDFARTDRLVLDWQHTLPLGDHLLVGGLTFTRERARLLSFGTAYDRTSREKALYLQDDFSLGALDLQAGVRVLDHSVYGRRLTWNLGVGHALGERTRLHANAGTAFRSPSANDLYGFGGNPAFRPERSRSFEVGLRHGFADGQRVTLNLFHTRIRDLIEADPVTFVIQQVERARIRGVELGWGLDRGALRLSIDYTWQDAENLDQNSSLARRAENKLDAMVGWDAGRWWTQLDLTAQSERRDSRFSGRVLGAYATLDLSAGYRIDDDWEARLDVTNLLDANYQLAGGYPAQGRVLLLGLRYAPGR